MNIDWMVCENCDYYEPWESESPVLVHIRHRDWSLEVNGSCRRNPPMMYFSDQIPEAIPGCPFFPSVYRNYWCGEGRWTDPETGNRHSWGDWDE
jgi:hypothetical protein